MENPIHIGSQSGRRLPPEEIAVKLRAARQELTQRTLEQKRAKKAEAAAKLQKANAATEALSLRSSVCKAEA